MEVFLNEVLQLIDASPLAVVYLILFVVSYLENVIPPIPGDVIVAFGGFLAATCRMDIALLLTITTAASVVGFMSMYALGNLWFGDIKDRKKNHWVLRFVNYSYFEKGAKWMERWGQGVVLVNRFLAGTRSIIALTAGFYKLDLRWTIISSLTSSLLWNSVLIGLGWAVQENVELISGYLSSYSKIILIILVAAVLGKFLWSYRNALFGRQKIKE